MDRLMSDRRVRVRRHRICREHFLISRKVSLVLQVPMLIVTIYSQSDLAVAQSPAVAELSHVS